MKIVLNNSLFTFIAIICLHMSLFSESSKALIVRDEIPKNILKDTSQLEERLRLEKYDFLAKQLYPGTPKIKDLVEEIDYEAPLARIPLEELPKLEDLFSARIPHRVLDCFHYLAFPDNLRNASGQTRGILLHGPAGTDLSSIAQIILRRAGFEILYTDLEPSEKLLIREKVDALFLEAEKIRKRIGRPVAIMIDGLDRRFVQSKRRPDTIDDGYPRLISLMTNLDQHKFNFDCCVLCTAHNPDIIDSGIMRRFIKIEIPPTMRRDDGHLFGLFNHLKNRLLSWFSNNSD